MKVYDSQNGKNHHMWFHTVYGSMDGNLMLEDHIPETQYNYLTVQKAIGYSLHLIIICIALYNLHMFLDKPS